MKFDIKKVLKALIVFKKAKKKVETVKTIASALKPNREVVQRAPNQSIGRATRQSSPTQTVVYDTFSDPGISSSHSRSSSSSSSSNSSSCDSSSSSSSSCD